MPVFTSDDDGKSYHPSAGSGEWPRKPGYPTGNVSMPGFEVSWGKWRFVGMCSQSGQHAVF